MRIYEVIWKDVFVEKLAYKHQVSIEEVESVLSSLPLFRKVQKGRTKGEDMYSAYGKTSTGRFLIIFFIYKNENAALPISDRDMTQTERKYYER